MLDSLVIWVVPWEFIKSLQLCYYPRVSYFYLSGVIISVPRQREKLGNRSVSLHLEKDNENQNITRRKNKQPNKKPLFISTLAFPYSKACIQILLVWLTLYLEWDHYINIRSIKLRKRSSEFVWDLYLDLLWNPLKWTKLLHFVGKFCSPWWNASLERFCSETEPHSIQGM